MLGFLFRRLTDERQEGRLMFEWATTISRQPHWYVEGEVPDTLDGRFAVLATIIAMMMVRLEREGPTGDAAAVGLTERFIEVMESEHRELGLGDPSLGKTVRKLVGMLARRTELWRKARSDEKDWSETARDSLYKERVSPGALLHCSDTLKRLEKTLFAAPLADVVKGKIG